MMNLQGLIQAEDKADETPEKKNKWPAEINPKVG